jgi:hypothetical protein
MTQYYHYQRQSSGQGEDRVVVREQKALPANVATMGRGGAAYVFHKVTRTPLGARAAGVSHGVLLSGADQLWLAAVTNSVLTLANRSLACHPVALRRTAVGTLCHAHANGVWGIVNTRRSTTVILMSHMVLIILVELWTDGHSERPSTSIPIIPPFILRIV